MSNVSEVASVSYTDFGTWQVSDIREKYNALWTPLDRLELALRKVKTAYWEHKRMEEKLLFPRQAESVERSNR